MKMRKQSKGFFLKKPYGIKIVAPTGNGSRLGGYKCLGSKGYVYMTNLITQHRLKTGKKVA